MRLDILTDKGHYSHAVQRSANDVNLQCRTLQSRH